MKNPGTPAVPGVHESYLRLGRFRYLKASLMLLALASAAYVAFSPPGRAGGGTEVGLALGIVCAGLLGWLAWFGVRKRTYRARGMTLREWLSAHVYLGLALLVLVPLHAGFRLGPNVHSVAYLLTCLTILSGVFGVALYGTVPSAMTENRRGEKLAGLLQKIANLDADLRRVAEPLPDLFGRAVLDSIEGTEIRSGIRAQLSATDAPGPTRAALRRVSDAADEVEAGSRIHVNELIGLLALKADLIARVGQDLRLKGLLDVWLVLHVPLAMATLAAVAVHVAVVTAYR